MYTFSDRSQLQAWQVKQSNHVLAERDRQILEWISGQFDVTALDFSFETREAKGRSQQIVHLIMDTVEDVRKIQSARAVNNKLITDRFLNYFRQSSVGNEITDPLKVNVLDFANEPHPEIILTCRPLEMPDAKVLAEMLNEEKQEIFKKFEDVWTMSQYVIFYYTDVQVKNNQANGISVKLSEALDRISKKYNTSQSYPYHFDSKESFDRDYEGKWHYYWK